jgi:hypothetical protein
VYEGPANGFTDTGLERETSYTYMLEAWNALGHSEPVVVEGRTVASPCPVAGAHNVFFNTLQFLYGSFVGVVQFVFIAVGLLGAYFRYRR